MRKPKEQTRTTTPLLADFSFYVFHTFSSSDFISMLFQMQVLNGWNVCVVDFCDADKDVPAENKVLILLNSESWINRTETLNGWNEALWQQQKALNK